MCKEGFVIYRSQIDALKGVDGETFKKCLLALSEYALNGVEYKDGDPIIDMYMALVKPQIDANSRRYENGKKGGRPKKIEKPKEAKPPVERRSAEYKEIIEYLNQKADKKFRLSESAKRHINARLNDSYTVEDFKTVIDNKAAEWKGDPKMDKYLKPDTLFGNKFDGYLNEKPRNRLGVTVPMPEFMQLEVTETEATKTTLDEVRKLQERMK